MIIPITDDFSESINAAILEKIKKSPERVQNLRYFHKKNISDFFIICPHSSNAYYVFGYERNYALASIILKDGFASSEVKKISVDEPADIII